MSGMLTLWLKLNTLLAQAPTPSGTPVEVPLPSMPPMEVTPLPQSPTLSILQIFLMIVQMLVAAGLVACVLSQTTKSEGLGGSIMGPSQSVFKGKKSTDEKLSTLTTWLAYGFIVLSIIVSFALHS